MPKFLITNNIPFLPSVNVLLFLVTLRVTVFLFAICCLVWIWGAKKERNRDSRRREKSEAKKGSPLFPEINRREFGNYLKS